MSSLPPLPPPPPEARPKSRPVWKRGWFWVIVVVVILIAGSAAGLIAAGTESSQTEQIEAEAGSPSPVISATPTASPTTPSISPEPTRPPKPRPQNGRLEGTYSVKYTLISSDIPGSTRVEQHRWRIDARCKTGGSCTARIESRNNDWKASAAWRGGLYRWARTIHKVYTCGSGGTVDYRINATYEYSIRGTRAKWDGSEWVIASFRGTFTSKGLRGCGLSGPPEEKYSLQGKIT